MKRISNIYRIISSITLIISMILFVSITGYFVYNNVYINNTMQKVDFMYKSKNPLWLYDTNKKIENLLYNKFSFLSADRISIDKFHNGKKDFYGIHFLYLSRTNELDKIGIDNKTYEYQDIPINILEPAVSDFVNNSCYIKRDISYRGNSIEQFFKNMGDKSIILCPLYDPYNNIIGEVDFEYTTKNIPNCDQNYIKQNINSLNNDGNIVF